jgi:putative peptidoglycan lipid II flippase
MSKDKDQITKATGLMIVLNLLARVSGFIRETITAKYFGATIATDAYLVATSIPNFFYGVAGSALGATIVPTYTQVEGKSGRDEASRVISIMLNITTLFLVGVTVFGMFLGPKLIWLIAPGFSPEALELATGLSNKVFFMLVFSCIGAMVSGVLNAKLVFGIPSFAPTIINVVMILCTIVFSKRYGIQGLAYGTLVGWAASLFIQIPALKRNGFRYYFSFDVKDPYIIKTIKLSLPLMAGMGAYQVYFLIDRYFASVLPEGSIASLNYSSKVMQLVLAVFITAISSAIFPVLSKQITAGKSKEFTETLKRALSVTAMLTIPATLAFIVIGEDIVTLLFKRGAFDLRAVQMTAYSLSFFGIGLLAHSWNTILLRAFTAVDNTVSTVKYAVITVVVNVVLSYLLRPWLAHGGLALANSLSAYLNSALFLWNLSNSTHGLNLRSMGLGIGKMFVAATLMTGVLWGISHWFIQYSILLKVSMEIILGVCIYGMCLYLFKAQEFLYLVTTGRAVIKKMFSKKLEVVGGKEVGSGM